MSVSHSGTLLGWVIHVGMMMMDMMVVSMLMIAADSMHSVAASSHIFQTFETTV
jgi:hypothetical protein